MFGNLKIVSALRESNVQINLSWEWKYSSGKQLPYCKVFCCTIPESRLIGDAIFTNEEILEWVTTHILDIKNAETRVANIEAYCSDVSNQNRSLNKYELTSGNSVFCYQQLVFPKSDIDKFFLICVYGSETFEFRILSVNTDQEIGYQVQKQRPLFSFGGQRTAKLKFTDASMLKRRVLVTRYNGREIYSVIPEGERLNLPGGLAEDQIEKVVYLSTLIGN